MPADGPPAETDVERLLKRFATSPGARLAGDVDRLGRVLANPAPDRSERFKAALILVRWLGSAEAARSLLLIAATDGANEWRMELRRRRPGEMTHRSHWHFAEHDVYRRDIARAERNERIGLEMLRLLKAGVAMADARAAVAHSDGGNLSVETIKDIWKAFRRRVQRRGYVDSKAYVLAPWYRFAGQEPPAPEFTLQDLPRRGHPKK